MNIAINYITSNGNNVKCFLQRNLSQCSTHIKSNCYQSLVYPFLEYVTLCGLLMHTQKNISTIEAVQNCAARYACMSQTTTQVMTCSVSDILTHLK